MLSPAPPLLSPLFPRDLRRLGVAVWLCSSLGVSRADAEGDGGRAEHQGHQPRSTDAICGYAAEHSRPLGVAGRRGSRNGSTDRCKQSTFMAAAADLLLMLLQEYSKRLCELYTAHRRLSIPQTAQPVSLPERQPGWSQLNGDHTGSSCSSL